MPEFLLPSLSAQEALARPGRLIDVRRRVVRRNAGTDVAGSLWIDPLTLDHSHPILSESAQLTFYCAHGHELSQFATALALVHKCDACFVRHGFAALVEAGAPLTEIGR
ncbi:MAG: hypothetical protein AAFR57_03350 [Pseudomonadota bacterium]